MSYIYEPKGKAGEYGELALNHYKGCSHGCKYCYVPEILYQTREEFHGNPQARYLNRKSLDRELRDLSGRTVFLCFTCDPYQPIDEQAKVTREIIQRLHFYEVGVNILTKGGSRSTRDFDLLVEDPKSRYGATLTFLDPAESIRWEPGAALPAERMDALRQAHARGIRTWASLEPVIDPAQSLELIRQAHDCVDEFKIGKWNHDPAASQIDWKKFAQQAVDLCGALRKKYYLKKDLFAYLK